MSAKHPSEFILKYDYESYTLQCVELKFSVTQHKAKNPDETTSITLRQFHD
jgi:hypothetical protein